jgi:hypothetical protein
LDDLVLRELLLGNLLLLVPVEGAVVRCQAHVDIVEAYLRLVQYLVVCRP